MSLATPAQNTSRQRQFALTDAACLLVLFCAGVIAFALGGGDVPLQMWDESRNANNALEMAAGGGWLVPHFAGVPDHWNTKPPLLIWAMAAAMRAGVPPLAAVRLPPMLAAFGVIAAAWAACRWWLQDRLAGLVAGMLILGCALFSGWHGAHTGDYDVPLSLFMLGHVLAFWRSTRDGVHAGWFAVSCAALVGAVLTKGVAGAFALPGLAAFALLSGRLAALARHAYIWLAGIAALIPCVGYYAARETVDPGYLRAVAENEFGGRFLAVNEGHGFGGHDFYLHVLWQQFRPGFLLVPLAALVLLRARGPRRSLCALCLLAALSVLLAISAAQTRLMWYAVPSVPLFAIAAGLGVSEAIAWCAHGKFRAGTWMLRCALAAVLAASTWRAYYRADTLLPAQAAEPAYGQSWYGALFDALHAAGTGRVVIVDGGYPNAAGFADYDPLLRFYTGLQSGLKLDVVTPGTDLAPGILAATCDPALRPDFTLRLRDVMWQNRWCVAGHAKGAPG